MALTGNPFDWQTSDKQGIVFQVLATERPAHQHTPGIYPRSHRLHGRSKCPACRATMDALKGTIGIPPMTFTLQTGEPVPPRESYRRLRNYIGEVHVHADEYGAFNGRVPSEPSTPKPTPIGAVETGPYTFEPEPEPTLPEVTPEELSAMTAEEMAALEPEPVAVTSEPVAFSIESEKEIFWREYERLQAWIVARDPVDLLDSLKNRPAKDGGRMIEQGIPAIACLHAMTLHWDDAVRHQAGVQPYDITTMFPGGMHAYLDALAKSRVLQMLVGEAGVGKSHYAEALADRLDVPFGSIPCTEGASPTWLLGKETMSGYKGTEFLTLWTRPSVFLLDELDAADPNMLLVINDALARGTIRNPVDQTAYVRHPDNILIATANTLGNGSSRYIRNELDPSTLDRFRMGRVMFEYDRDVARKLLFG